MGSFIQFLKERLRFFNFECEGPVLWPDEWRGGWFSCYFSSLYKLN